MSTIEGVAAPSEPAVPVQAPPWSDPTIARSRVAIAFVITLLISRLPEIVARELFALQVPWMAVAIAGLTIGLWLGARFVPVLRPLERFLAVMAAVNLLLAALPMLLESSLWLSLVPASTAPMVAMLATRVLYALLGLAVLGWAVFLGASRREVYARVGDVNAPTTTRRKDGTYVGWSRFGPIAMVLLGLLMVWFGFPMLPVTFDLAAAA